MEILILKNRATRAANIPADMISTLTNVMNSVLQNYGYVQAEYNMDIEELSKRRGGRQARRARAPVSFAPTAAGMRGGMYKPLTERGIQRIHEAVLEVLATVGVKNPTPTVRDLALARGCTLDGEGRLLFPAALVEDIVAGAAREFTLYGQTSAHDVEARAGQVHFATGGAAVKMLDSFSGEYRASTVEDIYDLARLCDTLPEIQLVARQVVPTEIEDWREIDLNTIYAIASGTTKHLGSSITQAAHVPDIVAMLDMMVGAEGAFRKRPFLSVHAIAVISPLCFAEDGSDVATAAVHAGMPILCLTAPQSGATAPAALAGALVQVTAETLASLIAVNLVRPGHPAIAGGWPFVSDLRTGAFSGGSGEQALLAAGMAQMMTHYDLPCGVAASMSDSKLPDNQSGYEKGVTTLLTALSGPTFVYESVGMLSSLLGCSLEATMIDAEMISNIRRCMRGIEVTEDTLSVEVIVDAARNPGHYLGHKQTLSLMQTEYVYPTLADRTSPDLWKELGSLDMWQRAKSSVRDLMCRHHPSHILESRDRAIREAFPIRLERKAMKSGAPRWKDI